ncbi:MAG: hypothetical protein IPL61_35710 [Myxococcales bacterium]|nr:hypothetical protein [Myxococcales bacterium]
MLMLRSVRHGLAAAGALTALVSMPPPARADDDWLGPDKALHFGASAGLAAGGYGASAIWVAPAGSARRSARRWR